MADDRAQVNELAAASVAFRAAPADAAVADERRAPDQRGAIRRDDLSRRLSMLPPGHPSSPYEADGGRKPPAPRLRDLELPEDQPADRADQLGEIRRLTDEEHAEHVADVRSRLDEARGADQATDKQYTIDPKRQIWSDERDSLHDLLIEDLYRQAANVPNEHRAIIAGGLGGAGKTTILENHAGIDRSDYLTINPDRIKEEMAVRGMLPHVSGLSPMEASDLVHEESSYVAQQLALRAYADEKNVIWDITMSSRETTERRIDELRAGGYTWIEGVFVDIPIETSLRRAEARHRRGHDEYLAGRGLGGRYVPPELVRAQADPEWGSRNRKTFEETKHRLNAWARYDNSVDDRAAVITETAGYDGPRTISTTGDHDEQRSH